jgi:hypothetical protein
LDLRSAYRPRRHFTGALRRVLEDFGGNCAAYIKNIGASAALDPPKRKWFY